MHLSYATKSVTNHVFSGFAEQYWNQEKKKKTFLAICFKKYLLLEDKTEQTKQITY